jgi:RNA polymerase sigma factor (sigma-70 family)
LIRLRDPADERAWVEFVEVYGPLVRRLARRRGFQHADVEDLVQEVFRVVSGAIERGVYDPSRGSFRGWLFRIARNLAVHRSEPGGQRPWRSRPAPAWCGR